MGIDKAHILAEIRRTTADNGGVPLGRARFSAETGIRNSDWIGKIWVNWGDAVREAGYEPNTMQEAYDEDWLLERLAGLVRELGHYPVSNEIRMKSRADGDFPSHNVFSRFGRKADVALAVMKWCGSHQGWDDVAAICASSAKPTANERGGAKPDGAPPLGYVYLFKSGEYYKIGRSNSPGRRQYELAIQLPEPVTTVHSIKTDDPAGIERYWHQRFADRRKNGEWFELSREDVSAFRRRKFM